MDTISPSLNEVLLGCNGSTGGFSLDDCPGCAVCKPSDAGDAALRCSAAIVQRQMQLQAEYDRLGEHYESEVRMDNDPEWCETETGAYMNGQLALLTEMIENGIATGLSEADQAFFARRKAEREQRAGKLRGLLG